MRHWRTPNLDVTTIGYPRGPLPCQHPGSPYHSRFFTRSASSPSPVRPSLQASKFRAPTAHYHFGGESKSNLKVVFSAEPTQTERTVGDCMREKSEVFASRRQSTTHWTVSAFPCRLFGLPISGNPSRKKNQDDPVFNTRPWDQSEWRWSCTFGVRPLASHPSTQSV